ncbi:hypothetical protein ACFFNX_51095, partial [Actinoallomurus acaciae]
AVPEPGHGTGPPGTGRAVRAAVGEAQVGDGAEKANAELTRGITELIALNRSRPGQDLTSEILAGPAKPSDEDALRQVLPPPHGGRGRVRAEPHRRRRARAAGR